MNEWQDRVADILQATARGGGTLTYQSLADRAAAPPPGRIQAVTRVLEDMIRADHAAGQPLRGAVAISKARDGLPGPGFFQLCREIGRYFGPDDGPQAALFHEMELRAVHAAARPPDAGADPD